MNWQNFKIVENIKAKLDEFVEKPFYLLGGYTKKFELEFAEYSQVRHCKTVANGTIALQLIIRSLDLKVGSKILVTSFCPIPTIMAILQEGFIPKFVDIDKTTLNISRTALEQSYDSECSAVIAVHIFGKLCPMDTISEFCLENNLALIEDACQAIGASHPDFKIGQLSAGAAMSFYPTKNLGSWGDAGGILTNDSEVSHKVACMRNYGLNENFESEMLGGNYRMDDLQALILSEKMVFLESEKQLRNSLRSKYESILDKGALQSGEEQNHHVISYLLDDPSKRDAIRALYKEYSLRNSFHYESPVFHFKALKNLSSLHVPNTIDVCSRMINLPQQEMDDEFYEQLVQKI
jgi:dTDP-4-amino-4,6-dideoxygalactose transaminase